MPASICCWGLFPCMFHLHCSQLISAAPGFSHLHELPSCQGSDCATWLQEEVAPGNERTLGWELSRRGFWPCSHLSLSGYCSSPLFFFIPVSPSVKWKDWLDCWGLFQHSHSVMLWVFGRVMDGMDLSCAQVAKLPLTSSRADEKSAPWLLGWKGPASFSTFPRLDGDNTCVSAVDKNKNWAKAITIWRVHYLVFKVTSHSFITYLLEEKNLSGYQ